LSDFTLSDLEKIVVQRGTSGSADSWTAKLFAKGIGKASQKLGEEAVEAVIAAVKGDRAELVSESADLLYHLMVVLALSDVKLDEVMDELLSRTSQSGLAEKAARDAS
jgi:phosphoribosyl-ATP pyrophosphohydrolase